jgi:hypothetical protein
MSLSSLFPDSAPPIKIALLPHIRYHCYSRGDDYVATWKFFSSRDSAQAYGLRIELQRNRDGVGEARLVKGNGGRGTEKHLRVIKLRGFDAKRVGDAVATLLVDFQAKGW